MSKAVQAFVMTDMKDVPKERIDAVARMQLELLARAQELGDNASFLNALAGAYVHLARTAPDVDREKARLGLIHVAAIPLAAEAAGPNSFAELSAAELALCRRLNALLAGNEHRIVVSALLNLFESAALQFDCCTAAAAQACGNVHQRLVAAARAPAASTNVH